ncbi:unnamed protein product [Closterium sp. Naga37s-1]|nr:unnamed protein product [Closterium sp. Naga37s-1]
MPVLPVIPLDCLPMVPLDCLPITPLDCLPITPLDCLPMVPLDCLPMVPLDCLPMVPLDYPPIIPMDCPPMVPMDCLPIVSLEYVELNLEALSSHAQTPPAVSAWPAVSAAFSGEWAGYSVDFSRFGQPLELPQSVVPEAFRDWGLVQYAWQSQTSSVARGETLGNAKILSSFVRYAPAAGCEAASPPKYSVERTVLELSAAPAAAAAAAAGELFAFTEDGSYLLVRAGQSSTMPAPASVDAMRATQWVPRGIDSTARDSNERDSDGGIRSMAAGPFQVEHCLALEGVEAASGKGRVRVRVVQEFAPQTAAAGGRGGNRGGGALAVPRLASLAMHREKWVEPFSGGAELADGAALFSSEMIEEGEGSEAPAISSSLVALELTEPIQTECSRQMETSALEDGTLMLLPEGVWSHVHKVDELSGESLFHVEVGWLFSSNQAIVSRANFDQSGNVKVR